MDRRQFLKTIAGAAISAAGSSIPGVALANGSTPSQESDAILEWTETQEKLQKSYRLVGKNETSYFVGFFGIDSPRNNPQLFVDTIKDLQKKYSLKQDGILGPKTLQLVYERFYSYEIANFPKEMQEKWNTHLTVQREYKYKKHTKLPSVFEVKYYYGNKREENIEGTYIDNGLFDYIGKEGGIEQTGEPNHVFIKKIGGLLTFLYYNEIGEIEIACVTSTGKRHSDNTGGPTSKYRNKLLSTERDKDINHTSSIYPKKNNGGAPMAYAVHVAGAVWIHVGDATGARESHGCIRLPYKYAVRFFEKSNKQTRLTILDN